MASLGRKNDLWPKDPNAGSLIPLTRDSAGKLHFSWPNALRGAVNDVRELVTAPGNAVEGRYTPSEMRGVGTRMALTLAGLGLGTAPGGANELRMFGGIRAKTADMPALSRALTAEGRGASPQDIHAATGWFRGPDNKWRFEIPDSEAMIHGQYTNDAKGNVNLADFQGPHKLNDVLHHPDLYTAYPQLKDTSVAPGGFAGGGMYFPEDKSIELGVQPRNDFLSTTLHEGQHAVQDIEGFAEGGGPEQFLSASHYNKQFMLQQNWDKLSSAAKTTGVDPDNVMKGFQRFAAGRPLEDSITDLKTLGAKDPSLLEAFRQHFNNSAALLNEKKAANTSYDNLAGEVEARAVQERHELGDHSSYPPSMPGYTPFDKQIVIVDGERQPMLATPVNHDPFAGATALTPIEHDPWTTIAEPVSHDPFATEETPK